MQYEKIGKFIHKKRLEMQVSLNMFALNNDIDPAILCRIENQKQDIKLKILNKIAAGFGLKTYEFLKEFEES